MEVRRTADRGCAVFATSAHRQGEIVLHEDPLFVRNGSAAATAGPPPVSLQRAFASAIRKTSDGPEAGDVVWDFFNSFCSADEKTKQGILNLYHPPLDDDMPKVCQALRLAETCWLWLKAKPSSCSLTDVQRGLLVDIFNNFDGSLFQLGCRMNHSCAPTLQHSDFGRGHVAGRELRVAFACWNEQLDYRTGVDALTMPLRKNIKDAVAVASNAQSSHLPLARLARAAALAGACALVTMPPGGKSLAEAMASAWAQPPSRTNCPQIPAFVVEKDVAVGERFVARPSAGKEFRAVRDIRAGEELTISYLSTELPPKHLRRAYLLGAYGFHCLCALCKCSSSVRPRRRLRKLQRLSSLRVKFRRQRDGFGKGVVTDATAVDRSVGGAARGTKGTDGGRARRRRRFDVDPFQCSKRRRREVNDSARGSPT